jgi:A/G-specific adenine glycosylase
MPAANLAAMRRRLLSWYETHKRDLPWRRTSDPYAVWLSEAMLQQTQVGTVIPYYNRFMQTLPNVKALDRAPLAKVLSLWSGLGYYRRAENLKKAARIVAARHGGELPADARKLRALPGIGEYTAGAILSIAFGQPHPAVDGNARRVLERLFLLSGKDNLRAAAGKFLSKSKPGQFNQSLMELGSVICTPKNPRCADCPLARFCPTHRYGPHPGIRPAKRAARTRLVNWPLAIVRCQSKLLLRRRATSGVLAGLWELPGGEISKRSEVQAVLEGHLTGVKHPAPTALGEIAHAITNRRIRAPVFLIELTPAAKCHFEPPSWRWVPPGTLGRHPTSSMTRKALRLLKAYEESHP